MTTILPAARSPWQVIDQAIGGQISQNLPGAVQQGFQRQTGLNAIDKLQSDLAASGGDLSKMIPAIARAYTLNPSLERSGIAEKLIPLAQRNTGTKDFPATSKSGMPLKEGGEVPVSVFDLVPPRQSNVANPQGVPEFQLPYGEEDILGIRQKARQLGYLPEMEERFAQDALQANEVAQTRRNVELQNYQQQQQQRRDTLENQKLFEKYIVDHDPEFAKNPDELELANKASEKYQNLPSFAERNAAVKNELRPYQAAKKAMEKTLNRPLFGQTKEQRDLARPRAQYMVEHGQKPQLQLMIAKGGMGEEEEADLLNPLPEKLDNQFKQFGKMVNPQEMVTSISPDSKEYREQLNRGLEKRASQKEHMVDFLSRSIEPGADYSHPGTNLLLTRRHLMDKGASWDEAGKLIDEAIEKGQIKLDPQQQIDSQRLAYPPLTGDSYFDTVMNHLMFPITGKR